MNLGPNDDGRRVDRILRRTLRGAALAQIYRAIRTGAVRLNGRRTRESVRAHSGDTLSLPAWLASAYTPQAGDTAGQGTLGDRILYQDGDVLVVNKRAGELTHGPGSLAEVVQRHLAGAVAPGVSFSPGPLHRLDRNTSGAVAFSVSLQGARAFSAQLAEGRTLKVYLALLSGILGAETEVVWESTLARDRKRRVTEPVSEGRHAVSRVQPVAGHQDWTLALVRLETGRAHQIRAQAAEYGVPLIGDRKYGGPVWDGSRYLLHAAVLRFRTGASPVTVVAPLHPEDRKRLVARCGTDSVALAEFRLRAFHQP